jgi:hypothetical protein
MDDDAMQDDDVFASRNVVLVPRRPLVCCSRHFASCSLPWVSRAPSRQDAVTSRAHIRLGSLQGCSGK